jgi:ribosomal protein S18 acetylase RimI-like enzyme
VVEIRLARSADRPGLAALYRARSSKWPLTIAREPLDGGRLLESLLPGSRRYVALAADGQTIIGSTGMSVAPTQLNGNLVVGAYRWGTHVHPAHRGQGVGRALAARSWDDARAEGARLGWGITQRSNEAAGRTFRHLGYHIDRTIQARLILPGWRSARRAAGVVHRAATQVDFAMVADALNAHYAGHHLWWPLDVSRLRGEALALGASGANLLLGVSSEGRRVAVAGVAVLDYALRLRGGRAVEPWTLADRLLGPLASVQLLRYAMLPAGSAEAGAAFLGDLQREHRRRALVLAANLDRLDPAWAACARRAGVTLPLDLWVSSQEPLAADRPCWLT